MKKVGLVVGVGGIVGRALMEEFDRLEDWEAIGMSRRTGETLPAGHHVRADLMDQISLKAVRSQLKQVTHIFYTAYSQRRNSVEEVAPNLYMLKNLVEVLEPALPNLQHIQLVHGSKWYGSHHGPYQTPAREDQPRHPLEVFYYAQQDWLAERQVGQPWSWSTVRPHGIWGFAIGSQLNMMQAVAVYATIMKHMGLPLYYPGKLAAFNALYQCTEASHLAQAMIWAATVPQTANQAFNITNGDFIRWKYAWPVVARWFNMEVGEVRTFDVAQFMADKESIWQEIRHKHGLKDYRVEDLTTWDAAISYMFNADWDQMSALTKIQFAGWSKVVDSYEMIPRQFDRLVQERIIPGQTDRWDE